MDALVGQKVWRKQAVDGDKGKVPYIKLTYFVSYPKIALHLRP